MRYFGVATLALIAGCASHPSAVKVGEDAAEVRTRLGAPYETVKRADGERLVYPIGTFAQQSYLIEVGADGRVTAVTPALTDQRFGMIQRGQWDQTRVRQEFGPPVETGVVPLKQQSVWSYRYKRDGVWDSLMHVYFDAQGKVQDYHPGPDPFFDPEDRGFFSGLLRP
jgi:hypothetical protein